MQVLTYMIASRVWERWLVGLFIISSQKFFENLYSVCFLAVQRLSRAIGRVCHRKVPTPRGHSRAFHLCNNSGVVACPNHVQAAYMYR